MHCKKNRKPEKKLPGTLTPRKTMRLTTLLLLLLGLFTVPAQAATSPWTVEDDTKMRLVSENETTGGEKTQRMALEIELDPGWHTYWRSPGEAGLPPEIEARTDEGTNVAFLTFSYPAPQRFTAEDLQTAGYTERVAFPLAVTLIDPNQGATLETAVTLTVCKDICVQHHLTPQLSLPQGPAQKGEDAALVEAAYASVPRPAEKEGYKVTNIERGPNDLKITVESPHPFASPDIFIETEKDLAFTAPQTILSDDKKTALFTLTLQDAPPEGFSFEGLPLTLTITNGTEAVEEPIAANFQPAENPASAPTVSSFAFYLALAFLGGFILNLTPCVLPVLSLKILSVMGHGGGERSKVRRSFLTTFLGILFSFWLLAGGTIAFQEAGQIVGWGMQFQHPLFLTFLSVLLTLFAANLWGLYEIPLPRFLADRMDAQTHPKLAGDFITGAFATLLATPCTAPFLGTAIGFALGTGPNEIAAIFTALGLGMGAPYLLVALHPGLATALPRPGLWMIRLKQILGIVLALTALWFLFVLGVEIAPENAFLTAGILLGLLAVFVLNRKGTHPKFFKRALPIFLLLPFFLALAPPLTAPTSTQDKEWQSFDKERLEREVLDGKTVFVDVTADWCLNCKVNKKYALSNEEVHAALFETQGTIAMQADWTKPNPAIATFMKKNGRYGIPFNAIYGPGAPEGIVLPELLTPAVILNALNKAR